MRSRLPSAPTLVVVALVAGSALVRFAVARGFTVPWIAPDEMLYGLLGESLWSTGQLEIRGAPSPFYSLLTPALVGAALAGRELAQGVEAAQLLQCVAMSSAAVPAYLWARRLAPAWWAVAAAALTLASPVLVYGGLLMTEALYYPACLWALYALAGALERPTAARQGVFLLAVTIAAAVRMQALVLLPAFALAVAASTLAPRARGRLRPLAPLAAGIAVGMLVLAALRTFQPGWLGSADLLGAYATLGETTAVGGGVVVTVLWHLAAVVLAVAVVPALTTVLLVVEVVRGRVRDVAVEAYAATVVGYVPLLVVQVALFASGRLDHVSQRYLVSTVPLLAVGLAAWAGAGAPRGRHAVAAVGGAIVALVVLVPPVRLAPVTAVHDALSTTVLLRLAEHATTARGLLLAAAFGGAALVASLPRRALAVLPVAAVVALAAASLDASRVVERLSAAESRNAIGDASPTWLDDAGLTGVSLLVTGDRPWEAVARTVFWNRSVTEVLRLPGVTGGVPPTPAVVELDGATGLLRDRRGAPLERELVATPAAYTLVGDRVAGLPVGTSSVPELVVWRAAGPLRVTSVVSGLLPNGDFSGEVRVLVPACVPGALEVTLVAKSGDPIAVRVNEQERPPIRAAPGETPTVALPAPGYVDGSRPCVFTLRTRGFVGTTRIAYVAAGTGA